MNETKSLFNKNPQAADSVTVQV